jgi:glycolate oxidase iron-sulfur subunit
MNTSREASPKKTKGNKFKNSALCTHCGYCLPVCPTYRIKNEESQSPRGRVSIILALAQGGLKPEEVTAALSPCLVCRACHEACPVGVRPAKLVLSARNLSPDASPWLSRILHTITNSHPLTHFASRTIHYYQKSGLQEGLRRFKILSLIPPLNRLERLIPHPRPDPIPIFPPAPPKGGASQKPRKAALLCGCMARLFHPGVAPSTANLLNILNIEVAIMEGFGCCGAPFRESGNRELFLKQARRTLDSYEKITEVDLILCDTSVCLVTIRSYGRALNKEKKYATLAQQFNEKIQSLEVLLAQELPPLLPSQYQRENSPLTFHDHCQTRHGTGSHEPPRQLIKKIAGPLQELPRADRCCGAGGDYMLRYPDLSHKIRVDKLEAIKESGGHTVVGSNSGCLLNIEAGLREKGSTVKVRHLSEAVWNPLSKLETKERSP